MEISKYNITLRRIEESDLEQLRTWRNSEYVSKRMIFTEHITEDMQKKWFESVNNDRNYYFLATYEGQKVGVIHVKDIVDQVGEGGIYLASEDFENTSVVARMVLCFNDYIFNELKLPKIYSHVKRDNKKAYSSSIAQGCIENKEKSTAEVIYFELTPENYNKKTIKLKNILSK